MSISISFNWWYFEWNLATKNWCYNHRLPKNKAFINVSNHYPKFAIKLKTKLKKFDTFFLAEKIIHLRKLN